MINIYQWRERIEKFIEIISVFISGLIFGSFFNVCIYRIPKKISIFSPSRSFCPHCKSIIKWYDNIPVLSYILLKGRCRNCNKKISIRYIIIEFITGLLFVLLFFKFGLEKVYFYYIILIGFIVIFSGIDLEKRLVINKLLLIFIFAGIIFYIVDFKKNDILNGILGFSTGGIVIYLLNFFSNGKIGEGDIKFIAAAGLWIGAYDIINVIFYSFLIGGFISSILLLLKIKNRYDKIAFIPFVALALFLKIMMM